MKINTNLSSLIVQNNLTKSTTALNQAIERMTTGYKINGAKDNAANYSIASNYESKISSLEIALDNTMMGMDMVQTAEDTLSELQNRGERLMNLWTQAQNGTYGTQSIKAIQEEVNSIVSEINRIYNETEYNGIKLFSAKPYEIPDYMPKAQENGFILDPYSYDDDYVASLTKVSEVESFESGQKYAIMTVDDLAHLAELVNAGGNTGLGSEFILGADLDLSEYCAEHADEGGWTAIGQREVIDGVNVYTTKTFRGTFDGNGHIIENLTINNTKQDQGLFGCTYSGAKIKNVGVVDVDISTGQEVGGIVGIGLQATITNCYSTGNIRCITGGYVGGISGNYGTIDSCYSECNVFNERGGNTSGGLIGSAYNPITNSYATGNVKGSNVCGSFVGTLAGSYIKNAYSTGTVTSSSSGFIGRLSCYTSSNGASLDNVISYGKIISNGEKSGSLVGNLINNYIHTNGVLYNNGVTITNAEVIEQDKDIIGVITKQDRTTDIYTILDYDMSEWLDNISTIELKDTSTALQVGVLGDDNSGITFDTNFDLDLNGIHIQTKSAYNKIQGFMDTLSAKATELGAVHNRLESAVESIGVDIENLTSSLSTIKDADIAQVSSEYIRQQILQQASATLLATANQSPAIALQLI